jgi:hypothetical protein
MEKELETAKNETKTKRNILEIARIEPKKIKLIEIPETIIKLEKIENELSEIKFEDPIMKKELETAKNETKTKRNILEIARIEPKKTKLIEIKTESEELTKLKKDTNDYNELRKEKGRK